MNMVEAQTRLDSLASERDQVLQKASKIVIDAVIGRIQQGKNTNILSELENLLSSFSIEERYIIAVKALADLASKTKMSKDSSRKEDHSDFFERSHSGKKRDRSDMFG